jgi:outer membrane lipoprotein-sorting protein
MKKGITAFLLILPLLHLTAQIPDAEQIMTKSREFAMMGSISSTIYLTITEKNGSVRNRTIVMSSKSYPDGAEKRIIKFLEPADVKGTGLLIVDNKDTQDEMWIYLPALKKTRRLITSEKSKSFMSSEFSNADMASPSSSDFKSKHLTGSGEAKQWVIESVPVTPEKAEEYGFSRKISWLNSENFQLKKIELYNFNNQLFKTIEIKAVKTLPDGKYITTDMKAVNLLNNRSSEFRMDKINATAAISDSEFTLQNLER